MISFRIEPIESAAVEDARTRASCALQQRDPTVELVIADEPNSFPCRHCLEDALPGERMLLFSHSPFERLGPYREFGPVFAHERNCQRASSTVIPGQLRRRLLALRGYSAGQKILAADVVQGIALEPLLDELLRKPEVAYVHARFAKFGCFACKIERA
jgi:hypothetical protein